MTPTDAEPMINVGNEDRYFTPEDHLFYENRRLYILISVLALVIVGLVAGIIKLAFKRASDHPAFWAIDNKGYVYKLADGAQDLNPQQFWVLEATKSSLRQWAEWRYTRDPYTYDRDWTRATKMMTDRAVKVADSEYDGRRAAVMSGKVPPCSVRILTPAIITDADRQASPYSARMRIEKDLANGQTEIWELAITFVIHDRLTSDYNPLGLFVDKVTETQEAQ